MITTEENNNVDISAEKDLQQPVEVAELQPITKQEQADYNLNRNQPPQESNQNHL